MAPLLSTILMVSNIIFVIFHLNFVQFNVNDQLINKEKKKYKKVEILENGLIKSFHDV